MQIGLLLFLLILVLFPGFKLIAEGVDRIAAAVSHRVSPEKTGIGEHYENRA